MRTNRIRLNATTLAAIAYLLAAMLLLLAGCDSPTEPELPTEYVLVELVGQSVPGAEVTLEDVGLVIVAAGSLVLDGERYTETLTVCDAKCRDLIGAGRYESVVTDGNGTMTFYPDSVVGGYPAAVTDGVLTWGPSVYNPVGR